MLLHRKPLAFIAPSDKKYLIFVSLRGVYSDTTQLNSTELNGPFMTS